MTRPRTLRHTPTVVFLSIPFTLIAAPAVAVAVAQRSPAAVVNVVPVLVVLLVLWRTRVVLVPGGVRLVQPNLQRGTTDQHGPTWLELSADQVTAVRVARRWQRGWATTLELRDGGERRAWALTAVKLAPGIASRDGVTPGLVERGQLVADHLGVPLRVGADGGR